MYLREIEIRNFMIIREAYLLLPQTNPVIGLVGRYDGEENAGRSNRAGKSTFIEAIKYLFFGKAKTRHHSKLINRAAKAAGRGLYVRGVFVPRNGDEFEIIRSTDSAGKATVEVTGSEGAGIEDSNNAIYDLVNFTYDEFQNTAYFGQGQIHQFMSSGPKEKRSLLLQWLNQTRWETRQIFARDEASKAATEATTIRKTLEALPAPEELVDELRERLRLCEAEAGDLKGKLEVARATESILKEEVRKANEQAELQRDKRRATGQIESVEEELEAAQGKIARKKTLRETLGELESAFETERDELQGLLTGAEGIIGQARGALEAAGATLGGLDTAGGACPLLGASCERIGEDSREQYQTRKDEAAEAALVATGNRNKIAGDLAQLKAEHIEEIKPIKSDIGSIPDIDLPALEAKLDQLDDEFCALKDSIVEGGRDAETIEVERLQLQGETERLVGALGETKTLVTSIRKDIERAEQYAERKQRLEDTLEDWQTKEAAWGYCQFMFGDRGIPGEYIRASFESLESDVNYLLGRLNCGLTVEFKPYRETKKFEPNCLACGSEFSPRERKCFCGEDRQRKRVEQLVLNIHDAAEGAVSEFGLDSGGGQVLISFAVRLALLFLKVRQGNGEMPPIVLDEIAGSLDPVNRSSVISVVLNILTEEFGVDQVFWISHSEEILDLLENAVAVTRFGDHSTVDWV